MNPRKLELLAPALNADIAIQAILHGADAVYMGPPTHGARKAAANSIEDFERVVDFAHKFRAKVYATVNTLVFDSEIKEVETLCRDLYHAGVDALIVQDMGILRMQLPPIALHASTQCDIRSPEKAEFLEKVGFSQLVLARELTLKEIKDITESVSIPVETFVHGALCVCYSGRCHASLSVTGRSANRGECAQICRFPYTLEDSKGRIVSKDKYLLSLKDFNAAANLEDLIDAGVNSFKIEGRLKDAGYVKNITSFYNQRLNNIIKDNSPAFTRSSYGDVKIKFFPKADKSFNRGFSNYFLENRQPSDIASLLTPKSQGELITDKKELNNGDGISFFDKDGNFNGVNINRVENGKIFPARRIELPKNAKIYRTSDICWDKTMRGETAIRKINLDIEMEESGITGKDERGNLVKIPLDIYFEKSRKQMDYEEVFSKLGGTPYKLRSFKSSGCNNRFYRISELTRLKRILLEKLDSANKATYPFEYRRKENIKTRYICSDLDYKENVANRLAKEFYMQHGVKKIEEALEKTRKIPQGTTLMTTRHCILRELGICRKEKEKLDMYQFPFYLCYNGGKFMLDFDCKACEMKLLSC